MTKKMVKGQIDILFELDNLSLDSAINYLTQCNNEYRNASLEVGGEYDSTYLYLNYEREETDKEYAKRIKAESIAKKNAAKQKEATEFRERKLLEELKAKYES